MKKKNTPKGLIIVLSAPSGCGKTTIARELLRTETSLRSSISATTRPRRRGERNGKDYYFFDRESFFEKRKAGFFIEWAKVFDHYYGTPHACVEKTVAKGFDILLTIDVQGTRTIKKKIKDAVYIFLLPPSMSVLNKRLCNRKTDTPSEIKKRLRIAKQELREAKEYDYVIVNDRVDNAVLAIKSIIVAEKKRVNRNKEVLRGVYST
jgi:guanylate kinase